MVLWVFGYGSLVWNPGFQEDDRIVGYIKGYRRSFDLGCIDHRGTPQFPARTCMLEEDDEAICWGAALCVKGGPEKEKEILQYLEERECEHDLLKYVDFYQEEGESATPVLKNVLVFTATPNKKINKYYLGPASLETMASQIALAKGPCGNNRDYLFKLEAALENIGHMDDMVTELVKEVRKFITNLNSVDVLVMN